MPVKLQDHEIAGKMLKGTAYTPVLTILFSLSIQTGKIPQKPIIPIPKSPDDPSNYRFTEYGADVALTLIFLT